MNASASQKATYAQVTAICGQMDEEVVTRIIDSGATSDQVLEAYTWLNAEEAIAPSPEHQMSEMVRRVYAILEAEQGDDEARQT